MATPRGRRYYLAHLTDEKTEEQQYYWWALLKSGGCRRCVSGAHALCHACGGDAGSWHRDMTLATEEMGLGSSVSPAATSCGPSVLPVTFLSLFVNPGNGGGADIYSVMGEKKTNKGWDSGQESACQCRRPKRCGFHPWVGKIPWRRKQQPAISCLENSMDRGAWWATVHGVSGSWTWLSNWAHGIWAKSDSLKKLCRREGVNWETVIDKYTLLNIK